MSKRKDLELSDTEDAVKLLISQVELKIEELTGISKNHLFKLLSKKLKNLLTPFQRLIHQLFNTNHHCLVQLEPTETRHLMVSNYIHLHNFKSSNISEQPQN